MTDALADINWLSVVAAAAAWFVLGAAWYMTPAIARKWQQAGGIEVPEDAGPNLVVFLLTFVAYLVASAVTAFLAGAIGISGTGEGMILGLALGVGFGLTAAAVTAIYDTKPDPFAWFWINGVFNLIGLTAVGTVIGAFV